MKKIILILIVLIALVFVYLNWSTAPTNVETALIGDSQINIAEQNEENESYQNFDDSEYKYTMSNFEYQFTGYGPGKEHLGKIESNIEEDGNRVAFNMTTVETGIDKLDEHLCSEDFFNCEGYPNSYFTLDKVNPISSSTARVTGVYEMKGISKNISFVANTISGVENLSTENLNSSYNGKFMLDVSEFNFQVPIVDENVLIEFEVSVSAEPIETIDESEEINMEGDEMNSNMD
jgi:hypothetical protein